MLLNETGKWTFSRVAKGYDAVRPLYPKKLIATYIQETQLAPSDRILEIGCGTGQLTRALAPMGFDLLAIDIGAELLHLAQSHCRAYPNVSFTLTAFEDLPIPDLPFDAVVCATAFHWLDPNIRLKKSAALLRRGGTLAMIKNVSKHREQIAALRYELDDIYARVIPIEINQQYISLDSKGSSLEQEFADTPYFRAVRTFSWRHTHRLSTPQYIRLLDTFSFQHNLPEPVKQQLFQEIAVVVDAHGGFIDLPYEAVLQLATKK